MACTVLSWSVVVVVVAVVVLLVPLLDVVDVVLSRRGVGSVSLVWCGVPSLENVVVVVWDSLFLRGVPLIVVDGFGGGKSSTTSLSLSFCGSDFLLRDDDDDDDIYQAA